MKENRGPRATLIAQKLPVLIIFHCFCLALLCICRVSFTEISAAKDDIPSSPIALPAFLSLAEMPSQSWTTSTPGRFLSHFHRRQISFKIIFPCLVFNRFGLHGCFVSFKKKHPKNMIRIIFTNPPFFIWTEYLNMEVPLFHAPMVLTGISCRRFLRSSHDPYQFGTPATPFFINSLRTLPDGCPNIFFRPTEIKAIEGLTFFRNSGPVLISAPWWPTFNTSLWSRTLYFLPNACSISSPRISCKKKRRGSKINFHNNGTIILFHSGYCEAKDTVRRSAHHFPILQLISDCTSWMQIPCFSANRSEVENGRG